MGLDPKSIKQIQDFMVAYAADGTAYFFSSHNNSIRWINCVQKILIIDKGESRGEYDISALKATADYNIEKLFFGLVKG